MNFALMLILRILAYFASLLLLLLAVLFALVGMIVRMPGNLIVFLSNICFILGNKLAKWILREKIKVALKQEVKK